MFLDRQDAGKKLAAALKDYVHAKDTIVVGLPRGGVVVGYVVAEQLNLPLDIVCPRKIGAPFSPELAIGAVTETGESIFSEDLISALSITPQYLEEVIKTEKEIAAARVNKYRKGRPKRDLTGKDVILVDDGLATGATMRAAIKTVRNESVRQVILAVPVAPRDTLDKLSDEVDKTICLHTPVPFYAVSQFYKAFDQTSDEEVISLLEQANLLFVKQ